jgi:hypothetical protein
MRFLGNVMTMPGALRHQILRRHVAVAGACRHRFGVEQLRLDCEGYVFGERGTCPVTWCVRTAERLGRQVM